MYILLILTNLITLTLFVLLHKKNELLSKELIKITNETSYRFWYLEDKLAKQIEVSNNE